MANILEVLLSFIGTVFDLIGYLITDIGIIISILFDPFLLLMLVFTVSHFYTILVSKTRKELIINYFRFFSMFFSGAYRVVVAAIPVMVGIIQFFGQVLSGLSANATVGSVVSAAIVAILAGYIIFSFL